NGRKPRSWSGPLLLPSRSRSMALTPYLRFVHRPLPNRWQTITRVRTCQAVFFGLVRIGPQPDQPIPAAQAVVRRVGRATRRECPPREARSRTPRGVPGEPILVKVDDRGDPALARRHDGRLQAAEIPVVVVPRRRFAGLPDEQQSDHVEAEVPEPI